MPAFYDCVVIGGGISGLATAFFLAEDYNLNVLLIEKSNEVGGKIRTIIEWGFIVESGPNGFLDNKPYALQLCEKLGIQARLYPCSKAIKNRYVVLNGKLVKIPLNPFAFMLSGILPFSSKLKVFLKEPFVKPAHSAVDESIAEFVIRRLDRHFLERLIDPMVAGIFAGNPYELSLKSCFPLMHKMEQEYGSLIKAFVNRLRSKGKASAAGPSGRLFSFVRGASEIIHALRRSAVGAGVNIELGVGDISLRKTDDRFKIVFNGRYEVDTKAVVVSTPAYAASSIVSDVHKGLADLLSSIPYAPISVVGLGYRKSAIGKRRKGFGFLVPATEGRKILGCLWDSQVFPNRAPDGFELVRVMIGGSRDPSLALLPENELVDIAVSELRDLMGVKDDPEHVWIFKHEKGIPQYTVGHSEVLDKMDRILTTEIEGMFLNSNAYRGVGINDCIYNSMNTANKVSSYLKRW